MPKYEASATYTDAEMLAHYREAEVAVLVKGQIYDFDGRILTRANLPEIRRGIAFYEARVNAASYGMVINLARRVRDC